MLAKLKFHKKNQSSKSASESKNWPYIQVFKNNIKKIVKIKDAFSKLSFEKIKGTHKIMNNINQKCKSKFNIITKSSSRKEIIISMSINNTERIIAQSNMYIVNINRLLKEVKSEISADYFYSNNKEIVIITNKIAILVDLSILEKYIKELNDVNSDNIISPKLLQSKLYLKISGIPYFLNNTNLSIMSDIIERVIKSTYIFNDIFLVSYS